MTPTENQEMIAGSDGGATDGGATGRPSDTGLNLATVWEAIADRIPARDALVHGGVATTWSEFDDRASRLAAALDSADIGPGDNIALYLYNCPQYMEATFAAFKIRAATVNVNYRYLEAELEYLFDNSDAKAVVFDAVFTDRIEAIRERLTKVALFVCAGATGDSPVPDWAVPYEDLVSTGAPMPRIPRSDSDLWILYTGGTTGSPKGVMWPHSSLLQVAKATFAVVDSDVPDDLDQVRSIIDAFVTRDKFVTVLPAAPLMHGTSALTSLGVLCAGGTIVTLTSRTFDADELWQAVSDHDVTQLTIVGDAFARPMLESLERASADGHPYDVSSLKIVLSSGVMWSKESKDALHEWTAATFADSLGSSEGVGFATSVSRRGASAETARFRLGPDSAVFTDDDRMVEPGSGERGMLAVGGAIPIGYYNDPVKTASTFRTIDGRVWSVPGDYAMVNEDGTIQLLGRGSACINTAGEKVYPEEVEEILKTHPMVRDANVVGISDEKWGSAVHAVVSLDRRGNTGEARVADGPSATVDDAYVEDLLRSFCRESLAGYKCPKRIHVVDQIQRGPNGKPDYRWATSVAEEASRAND